MFEQIQPLCDVALTVQVTDSKTGLILPLTAGTIYDANENKIANKTTDENGEVMFKYACNEGYRLEANKEMYKSNSADVAKTDEPEVSVTIPLDPIEIIEDKVVLNPIYFELDKHNITAQGASELDKLVEVMTRYPKMIIKRIGDRLIFQFNFIYD